MDKNKKQILIACALGAVLALLVLNNIVAKNRKTPHSRVQEAPAETSFTGNLSSLVSMRKNDAVYMTQWKQWEGDWGRDPFVEEAVTVTSAAVTEVEHLLLQGIFWDEQNPKAIMNDKMLSQGDTLGSYKVMEIKPRSVVLSSGEKTIEVRVFNALSSEKSLSN